MAIASPCRGLEPLRRGVASCVRSSGAARTSQPVVAPKYLARYGKPEASHRVLPKVSQQTLAEMVGTTRSRVNLFMNKFRKLGFIEYDDNGIRVSHALLSVVLHE